MTAAGKTEPARTELIQAIEELRQQLGITRTFSPDGQSDKALANMVKQLTEKLEKERAKPLAGSTSTEGAKDGEKSGGEPPSNDSAPPGPNDPAAAPPAIGGGSDLPTGSLPPPSLGDVPAPASVGAATITAPPAPEAAAPPAAVAPATSEKPEPDKAAKASAPAAQKASSRAPEHRVAPGQAIVTSRGVVGPDQTVRAEDLEGGLAALDALVNAGLVIRWERT